MGTVGHRRGDGRVGGPEGWQNFHIQNSDTVCQALFSPFHTLRLT